MNSFRVVSAGLVLAFCAACGGLTTLPPTGHSPTSALTASPTSPVEALSALMVSRLVPGTAGPLRDGAPPCFADRYPCETFDFSLAEEGSIEVAVTWEGPTRALLVQLYWAGEGLAHEDVAPRNGPPRIYFRRPRMEAANYSLRIVNLEPTSTIPFMLTLTH